MKTASELAKERPSAKVFTANGNRNGDVELARKLCELRTTYNLTLRQVEEETGLSNPYLSQLENACAMPSVAKLARLAAFYETTLDGLCGHMVEQAKRGA